MSREHSDDQELKRNIGLIVSIALIASALTDGAGALAAALLEHRDLQPGAADYIEFAKLYIATFLMSATLTLAVAAWCVPPLFGRTSYWQPPLAILVAGAWLTGLPVQSVGGTPLGWGLGALNTFTSHYGTAAFGGFVSGAAGGAIVVSVAEWLKKKGLVA